MLEYSLLLLVVLHRAVHLGQVSFELLQELLVLLAVSLRIGNVPLVVDDVQALIQNRMRLLIFEHVLPIFELGVPFHEYAVRACICCKVVGLVHLGVPVLLVLLPGPIFGCHCELDAVVGDLVARHELLHLPLAAGEVIDLVVALELAIFSVHEFILGISPGPEELVMVFAHRLEPSWRNVSAHAKE